MNFFKKKDKPVDTRTHKQRNLIQIEINSLGVLVFGVLLIIGVIPVLFYMGQLGGMAIFVIPLQIGLGIGFITTGNRKVIKDPQSVINRIQEIERRLRIE